MAKKPPSTTETEAQRQSRKEMLIARKHERQMRNVRIAVIVIAVLIALVLGIALVNELFITPNRAVATVGETPVTLRDWQARGNSAAASSTNCSTPRRWARTR